MKPNAEGRAGHVSDDVFKIDQFTVTGDIASGQVSDVFEVIEDVTGKQFALKLLREEIVNSPTEKSSQTILSQFKQEFKLGQMLEHPLLVHVHEFKFKVQTLLPVKDPIAYFTMDYFRSQNLKAAMTAEPLWTQRHLQKILEQICEALGYVHSKGWVHRDVKPDNLLTTKSAEARLIDFSLACKIKKKHRIIQGTRTYIAPETIKKDKAVPQTDMYSLGVTIYEVLTGQPPFTGASPTDLLKRHLATKPPAPSLLNDNVAPELDRLVQRLMAKLPKDRFESMEDLVGEIRNTRFFKEEIPESFGQTDDDDDVGSIVKTLDSRADAARSQLFEEKPELARQYEEERKADDERRARKKAEHARTVDESSKQPDTPAAQPAPAVAMPQPMPIPNPAAMMPGMPMAPMMPMPGMPGAPMMPMPGMPGAPMMPTPGMPVAPMMPTPGMPVAPMMPTPGMPVAPMMPAPGMPPTPGLPPAPIPMPTATPTVAPTPPAHMPGTPTPDAEGAGGAIPLPGQPATQTPQQTPQQTGPPPQPSPTGQTAPAPPTPPAPAETDIPPEDLPLMEELPEIE